mgnify:CR=1 FL=1
MKKIYLKYDDEFSKPVSCDYGPVWQVLIIGPIYFIKKKDYKYFFIVLITQILISSLLLLSIKNIKISILMVIIMLSLINFLFATNYNMIVIESLIKQNYIPYGQESIDILRNKGIYFKLY